MAPSAALKAQLGGLCIDQIALQITIPHACLIYSACFVHTGQLQNALFCPSSRWQRIFSLPPRYIRRTHKQLLPKEDDYRRETHRHSVFLRACSSHGRGGAVMSLFTQAMRLTWQQRRKNGGRGPNSGRRLLSEGKTRHEETQ